MVLEFLIPKLKNEHISWFSDNQNVVRIMEIGQKARAVGGGFCNILYCCSKPHKDRPVNTADTNNLLILKICYY